MTTTIVDPRGKLLGGFACEYSGSGTKKEAEKSLSESISGMIKRRGYGNIKGDVQMYKDNKTDTGYIIHPGKIFVYKDLDVDLEHGSVFTAICFVSYKFPTLSKSSTTRAFKNSKKTRKNMKK